MPELAIEILTLYGPLGFGWVVAFALWRHYEALFKVRREDALRREELVVQTLQNNTKLIYEFKILLQERIGRK